MPTGALALDVWVVSKAVSLLLALLVQLGTAATSTTSSSLGNVNLQGTRKAGDQLLFEYRVTRRAKPFKVITEAVEYPMTTGQKPGVITLIEVRSPKRRHDEVHIKSGGVGEKAATILFKSARGRGLDYTVNIFGFPAAKPTTAVVTMPAMPAMTEAGDAAPDAAASSADGEAGAAAAADSTSPATEAES